MSQQFIVTGVVNSKPTHKGVSYEKNNYNFFLKYDNIEGLILPNGNSSSNTTMFVMLSTPVAWGTVNYLEKGKRIIAVGHQDSNAANPGDVVSSVYTKIDTAYECQANVIINDASGMGTIDQVKVENSYIIYTIKEKKKGANAGNRIYQVYRPVKVALPVGSVVFWRGHILAEMFTMPEGSTPFTIGNAPMFYATSLIPLKIATK